jgi:tetratricopeptide (TPR) repeat protein
MGPVEDLERQAISASLTGRDTEFQDLLDRAYHTCVQGGDGPRAARCAFWLGLSRMLRGDTGQATGWLARAQRIIEGSDCVEHGYLLLPAAEQHLGRGRTGEAETTAAQAAAIGERFGNADLIACARHLQGRALLRRGRLQDGLALLDEAMLPAIAGEVSPIMTGLIYCSVLDACRQVFALSRAREWTAAFAHWCERQPEMVAFTPACLVHRAEVPEFSGDWPHAMAEARRACERNSAAAFYRLAELHRLRGEFVAAEAAYRNAARLGREPQPGLALLRLAQGRTAAASAAIRRVLTAAAGTLYRNPGHGRSRARSAGQLL